MIHAEIKGIEDFIGMPKNDIEKRKREDKNIEMLKDGDAGNFGKKV